MLSDDIGIRLEIVVSSLDEGVEDIQNKLKLNAAEGAPSRFLDEVVVNLLTGVLDRAIFESLKDFWIGDALRHIKLDRDFQIVLDILNRTFHDSGLSGQISCDIVELQKTAWVQFPISVSAAGII